MIMNDPTTAELCFNIHSRLLFYHPTTLRQIPKFMQTQVWLFRNFRLIHVFILLSLVKWILNKICLQVSRKTFNKNGSINFKLFNNNGLTNFRLISILLWITPCWIVTFYTVIHKDLKTHYCHCLEIQHFHCVSVTKVFFSNDWNWFSNIPETGNSN